MGGVDLSLGVGYGSNFYTGVVAGGLVGAGSEAGAISSSTNIGTLTYSLVSGKYQDWIYNYEFETIRSTIWWRSSFRT